MSGIGNMVKLIGLSFMTRKEYDLLVKYSLAISLFWFLTLVAPILPYAFELPIIENYASYSEKSFLIFSLRSLVLFFVPLVLGYFYLASDEFQERHQHRAIRADNYVEGLRILSQKHDLKSKELILVSFAALGKGLGLVLNWVIIYTFIVLGLLIELFNALLGGERSDRFFELWRFADKDQAINEIGEIMGDDVSVYDTSGYGSAPYLIRPLLLFGNIFFGEITFITSKNVDVIMTSSGIGGTGQIKETRSLYMNLVDYSLSNGILCAHPTSIEIEARVGSKVIDYQSIYEDPEIPIEDIKWLRLKSLIKTGS